MTYRVVKQVAQEEGITTNTVYGWVAHGKLSITKVGSQIRITDEAWEAFLIECNKPKIALKRK
jgi:excisionase family DNA binding protein